MFFLILLIGLNSLGTEARVFCQDSNASPRTPLGYSCPVNCDNIITAVKTLKMRDYKIMASEFNENLISDTDDVKYRRNYETKELPHNETKLETLYRYYKILTNEKVAADLKMELSKMAPDTINGTCSFLLKKAAMKPNLFVKKLINKKCTRRYNLEDDFMKKFTAILNRYTHSEYQFTEEMTTIVLEKILGKNMDLRHGIFDVNKIVRFLGNALRYHRTHANSDTDFIIKLKSKHCFTTVVAGCYCKTGFVESSGQCVMPPDCLSGSLEAKYLSRISVF